MYLQFQDIIESHMGEKGRHRMMIKQNHVFTLYLICLTAVLILYLTNWLGFSEDVGTAIFHSFVMLCYLSPLIGAVLADGYLGRYK